MQKTAWRIAELEKAMETDLMNAKDLTEKFCIKAICGKEIRLLAENLFELGRLTRTESIIAQRHGFRNCRVDAE